MKNNTKCLINECITIAEFIILLRIQENKTNITNYCQPLIFGIQPNKVIRSLNNFRQISKAKKVKIDNIDVKIYTPCIFSLVCNSTTYKFKSMAKLLASQ